MRPRSTLIALVAVVLLTVACASGGRGSTTTARLQPPTVLSGPRPEFRFPSVPRDGRVLDISVTVQIDSAGQPDLESLRVTGLGAAENRDAIATWVRNARFRPAQQAGRPVPGAYQTRFAVRAQTRRVS